MLSSNFKLTQGNISANVELLKYTLEQVAIGLGAVEYVDLPTDRHPFWQNEADTMVLYIKDEHLPTLILKLAQLAVDYRADELEYKRVDNKLILRVWWD